MLRSTLLAVALLTTAFHSQSSAGSVTTWGQRISRTPIPVTGLPQAVDIQAANWGGLATDASGNVWQWTQGHDPTAVEEPGPTNTTSIGEGYWFSAAVDGSGDVWTWGDNAFGDLCQGKVGKSTTKPAETSVTGAISVTGGASHLAILLADGRVLSCGQNNFGQLGHDYMGGDSGTPVYARIRHVVELSAGDTTDVALKADGTVWDWGQGNVGQLGDGAHVNSDLPVEVPLESTAVEVYGGGDLNSNGTEIALLKNGTVWAWGYGRNGQLGPRRPDRNSDVPVEVPFQAVTVTWVGMGGVTGYALDSKGDLWAWGSNDDGQYGDGSPSSVAPVIVQRGCNQASVVADKVVAFCP
jgi:alpha-tubulin suppressor-like RCC1 family protein